MRCRNVDLPEQHKSSGGLLLFPLAFHVLGEAVPVVAVKFV